jgi:hypothetical protein
MSAKSKISATIKLLPDHQPAVAEAFNALREALMTRHAVILACLAFDIPLDARNEARWRLHEPDELLFRFDAVLRNLEQAALNIEAELGLRTDDTGEDA